MQPIFTSNGLGISRSALGCGESRGPSAFQGKTLSPQPEAFPAGDLRNRASTASNDAFAAPGLMTFRAIGYAAKSAICNPGMFANLLAKTTRNGSGPIMLAPFAILTKADASCASSLGPRCSKTHVTGSSPHPRSCRHSESLSRQNSSAISYGSSGARYRSANFRLSIAAATIVACDFLKNPATSAMNFTRLASS